MACIVRSLVKLSLTSRFSICEAAISGGNNRHLHRHRLACQFHFVGFHSVVSWSFWGIVLVCS